MTPQQLVFDIISRIVARMIGCQQPIKIDGREFRPAGVLMEDGSGLRWLIDGCYIGTSYEHAQVFIDFTQPHGMYRICFD